MKSTYKLEDFLNACKQGVAAVQVMYDADQDAKAYFKLKSKSDTLQFISSGGASGFDPINTDVWRNNPNKATVIMVDAYDFFAGTDFGYMAFMYQPVTNKWLLKSFKKNDKPDPRQNTTMGDAFKQALQKASGEGK